MFQTQGAGGFVVLARYLADVGLTLLWWQKKATSKNSEKNSRAAPGGLHRPDRGHAPLLDEPIARDAIDHFLARLP